MPFEEWCRSCGGFCLTNYQPEIAENFEDGVDLVMFSGMADLLAKTSYYLEHEEERKAIAEHGNCKVREHFGLTQKVREMWQMVQEE